MKVTAHIIEIHAVPTPAQRDTILAAVKWIERIHDRKEMLPASFLDNTDPLPIAKKLREMLGPRKPIHPEEQVRALFEQANQLSDEQKEMLADAILSTIDDGGDPRTPEFGVAP